jgi:DNA-binding protein YbaB
MQEPNKRPTISQAEKDALSFFSEHAFPPVDVAADGLVAVKMTSRFELTQVTIDENAYHSSGPTALAYAVQKAVNEVIRKVAEANAKRLNKLSASSKSDS